MKVDAHQHFWRYRAEDHAWIGADMTALRQDCLPQDLLPLLRACGFDRCVAVQARGSEIETQFLLHLAEQHDCIAAVVGWVDLRAVDLPARLERWGMAPKLAGFRHLVQDEPDVATLLADPRFLRGVARVQEQSRVYEILVHARQLAPVPEFCATSDRYWLVLDHLGKPAIRDRDLRTWRTRVLPLADMQHVVCKISGLVTEAMNAYGEIEPAAIAPYLDTALEIFGSHRLMFGSDWPVCLLAASYPQVVEIVERWAERLSVDERDAIWGETARRIYGLQ
jgi:L-fuconolactonase